MKPFRFFLFTLLAALASCSDGIEDVAPAITSYTGLALAVPQVIVSSASKTMNATPEECTAKDLYLFCFPQKNEKGEEMGVKLTQELTGLTAQKDLNGDASLYNIILQPGTYHVYVVANMGDKSIGTDDNGNPKLFKNNYSSLTEDQLKALTLSYDATTLPTAGNIPMVYASDKDVVVYDGKATEVAANLTFTCAKVVVNIIFDPENTLDAIKAQQPKAAEVFKNNINWLLTSVKGNNLTASTNLFTAPATSGDGALSAVDLPAGSFYDGYDYIEANQNVTNADVVTPKGTAVATLTDALTNARKWLYRATYYLPERSVTEADTATALPVTGTIKGGKEYTNTYNNISGDKLSTFDNNTYKLERGHYYEIVSFVNGLGQYDLPTKVEVKDWTPVQISADFLHTTLWVEKTQIGNAEDRLTTLTTASMTYKTNALPDDINSGCATKVKVGDKDVDVISITNDKTNKALTFTVNPDIPFSSYTTENKKNTAKVWIQAGNIKKYIDVYYSAEPFLIVTPQEEVIYWTNSTADADKATLKKTLTFKTNLGGITLAQNTVQTQGTLSKGNSTVTVKAANKDGSNGSEGTITVEATKDPVTTTEHTFTVYPQNNDYKSLANTVKVTVKPAKGYYRIYMRAINDLQWYNGGSSSLEWSAMDYQPEDDKLGTSGSGNWRDGWKATYDNNKKAYVGDWDNKAREDNHYAYIYTQIGETETAADKDKMPAWIFTEFKGKDWGSGFTYWPGDPMKADGNNPGWYYIDEAVGKKQVHVENASGDKVITPGQTLIIFNNNTYQSEGYALHRFSHHLDPGIPLFNYDDNEGWYLYDPTCDPYYRVFDDKPKVEDITYVIYTSQQVTGWYHRYGVGANTTTPTDDQMFKIHSEHVSSEKSGSWYKTTLTFKCPHGYYEKAIKLKLEGVTDEPVLFGGHNWTPTNNTITGYYDGSSWHKDDPTSSAKRRR